MRSLFGSLSEAEICGAKTRGGRPCKNAGMYPSGRCRMHGGKSYRGIASPRYKHGRYSKEWLVRFMARMRDEPEKVQAELDQALAEIAAQPVDLDSLIGEGELFADWDPAIFDALDLSFDFAALDLPEDT
jgi:hypothetical protein